MERHKTRKTEVKMFLLVRVVRHVIVRSDLILLDLPEIFMCVCVCKYFKIYIVHRNKHFRYCGFNNHDDSSVVPVDLQSSNDSSRSSSKS